MGCPLVTRKLYETLSLKKVRIHPIKTVNHIFFFPLNVSLKAKDDNNPVITSGNIED